MVTLDWDDSLCVYPWAALDLKSKLCSPCEKGRPLDSYCLVLPIRTLQGYSRGLLPADFLSTSFRELNPNKLTGQMGAEEVVVRTQGYALEFFTLTPFLESGHSHCMWETWLCAMGFFLFFVFKITLDLWKHLDTKPCGREAVVASSKETMRQARL